MVGLHATLMPVCLKKGAPKTLEGIHLHATRFERCLTCFLSRLSIVSDLPRFPS